MESALSVKRTQDLIQWVEHVFLMIVTSPLKLSNKRVCVKHVVNTLEWMKINIGA